MVVNNNGAAINAAGDDTVEALEAENSPLESYSAVRKTSAVSCLEHL